MEFIPQEHIQSEHRFNFAPMVDFLFLMLALFATLAISKATLLDTEITLAQIKTEKKDSSSPTKLDLQQVHLSITQEGGYKWLMGVDSYGVENIEGIHQELARQQEAGLIAQDCSKTEILLHIDQKAPWHAIASALISIRELGFNARPVCELQRDSS